jgi:outer membrane lipoprotein-sorting protein
MTALASLLCVSSAGAFAQNQGVELLKKMEAKFEGLKSVSGTFTQNRTDPTFKTQQTVPARFYLLKPSYFRAEFQDAQGQAPSVQLISKQMFYHYVPQLNQVNTYKFQGESNVRDLNWLLLGFGAKTAEITKVYAVKPLQRGTGVTLTPHSTKDSSFKYITMQVDPQTLYPTHFTMRQTDNTDLSVAINAGSLQLNPSLSPRDFEPNFPANAAKVNMQ